MSSHVGECRIVGVICVVGSRGVSCYIGCRCNAVESAHDRDVGDRGAKHAGDEEFLWMTFAHDCVRVEDRRRG